MFNANNTRGSNHRYVNRVARDTIRQSRMLNDGTIPDRTFNKVQWYMVEAVIMGEMLARLSDHSVSKRDKESLIYLGAVMALFDIITDDFKLGRTTINRILENTFSTCGRPESNTETAIEKIYYLYHSMLLATIEREHWIEITEHLSIIKLQVRSDEQFRETISEEHVTGITLGKGGVSALICSAFLQQRDDSFRKAVFEIGGFIQMMNDCQDIHEDTVAGIKTFVHFRKDFSEIYAKLDEQRRKTFQMISSLDYSTNGRRYTLFDLNAMFVVIAYKLKRYADTCDYILDFNAISEMDKKKFRINPFSPRSFVYCSGKIIRFDPEDCEAMPVFKFGQSQLLLTIILPISMI